MLGWEDLGRALKRTYLNHIISIDAVPHKKAAGIFLLNKLKGTYDICFICHEIGGVLWINELNWYSYFHQLMMIAVSLSELWISIYTYTHTHLHHCPYTLILHISHTHHNTHIIHTFTTPPHTHHNTHMIHTFTTHPPTHPPPCTAWWDSITD